MKSQPRRNRPGRRPMDRPSRGPGPRPIRPAVPPPPQKAKPDAHGKRAFSVLHGSVLRGGTPELAGWTAALFKVDPARARQLTHGFHPYAARMHPMMARAAVARLSAPGDLVLDPFCGSGTVLVEALVAGRSARGFDASPLAVELARVKTDPLDEPRRQRLVQTAAEIAATSAALAQKRQRPDAIPAWSRRAEAVFPPHVFLELLGLRALVMVAFADDKRLARALRLSLSSILGKFTATVAGRASTKGTQTDRTKPDKRIARGLPSEFFARRVQELARNLATLERAIAKPPRKPPTGAEKNAARAPLPPYIAQADARALGDDAPSGGVALIVTSPPYAGTYDYADLHAFRYPWLNLQTAGFRKRQIGQPGHGLGADPGTWHQARQAFMSEISRVLRPGGHALLVIGDGVVGNRPEDALQATADVALTIGLEPVAWASQDRDIRDRRLSQIFAANPHREHLLLLRK